MAEQKKGKKFTKKKAIIVGVVAVIAAVGVGGMLVINHLKSQLADESQDPSYDQYVVSESDPLMFDGVVQPQDMQEIYYDASLGKIKTVAVTNQQEVKKGDVLFTYENGTVQEQVGDQERALNRASLAVEAAKENLQSGQEAVSASQAKVTDAKNKLAAVDKTTPEGQAQAEELNATIESLNEEVKVARDNTKQLEQALSSAQLDLNDANQEVESSKKNITSNVTAPINGIVYVEEKGQSNPEVALIKLVSKDVVVTANVTEFDYSAVKVDVPVTVTPNVSDEKINGKVATVSELSSANTGSAAAAASNGEGSNSSSSATYAFTVKIDQPLQYGFNVQISLAQHLLKIPESTVVAEGKDKAQLSVFKLNDGVAVKTTIEATKANGFYTVTKGLAKKDAIILSPDDALKDGITVNVE